MTLTVTDRTTVRPPERVGKYPIVRILGEGAMGVVYEAFDPVIRRPLAIKTIRRALMDSDAAGAAAVARFKTEARAAGGLAHPGIAAVYEYGEDPLGAYIAMEFVNGNTLRDYIARGTRFAEEDVLAIMAQLLSALGYAHAREVTASGTDDDRAVAVARYEDLISRAKQALDLRVELAASRALSTVQGLTAGDADKSQRELILLLGQRNHSHGSPHPAALDDAKDAEISRPRIRAIPG